jgi:hypothetical protein
MAERDLERTISPEEIENIKINLKKGIKSWVSSVLFFTNKKGMVEENVWLK